MNPVRPMLFCLAMCALLLGGCASTAPTPTGPVLPPMRAGTIARLVVDGPNAFINSLPAQTGSYIHHGDKVSTGSQTSAMLLLNEGGFIQLDENTDPLFRQGKCLLLSIVYGRLVFQQPGCTQFTSPPGMEGVVHSMVHVAASEQLSRVTVIEGQVDMLSPAEATLRQYDEYVAPREGPVEVLRLTPEEAAATAAWTRGYFREPVAAPKRDGITGLQATAAAAVALIFYKIFRKKDKPENQQRELD